MIGYSTTEELTLQSLSSESRYGRVIAVLVCDMDSNIFQGDSARKSAR
jgi:hypothetical protein